MQRFSSWNLTSTFLLVFLSFIHPAFSQEVDDNQTCIECHGEEDITGEINEREISMFIDSTKYEKSIHGEFACIDCHDDIEEIPHEFELNRVECSNCHDDQLDVFSKSVHGVAALERNDALAPKCFTCHGKHDVLPPTDPESKTFIFNIPATCGQCHKEGTPMTETHEIHQHNVVANYSMSIHGEGLLKRGLTVTAVCTSCHGDHDILPHQNPNSSINIANLASTCMTCHGQIDLVHEKVIEGRLWQQDPTKLPACIDCHQPHEIRRVYYDDGLRISDETCMTCHQDEQLHMEEDGEIVDLFVDRGPLQNSIHSKLACVSCHIDVHPENTPVCKNSQPVDCSICHEEMSQDFLSGIHGQLEVRNDPDAPSCVFCHGDHEVLSKTNSQSKTFSRNVPALCSQCHADGQSAAMRNPEVSHIQENYSMSIHGKGLFDSGLTVTAMCTDCHTAHKALPASDPNSSVNPAHVGETCGKCHLGIFEKFNQSIHSPLTSQTEEHLPTCHDCHQSHSAQRTEEAGFREQIIQQCGHCHEELTESYFETYHGKVSKLGDTVAARCNDCHGSHSILPTSHPNSSLHFNNIIDTCKQCHPGSHRKFTGFLTHATHHDKENYPSLYYSFLFMTTLLVGTLGFFGVHTILWFIRSLIHHIKHGGPIVKYESNQKFIRRFRPIHRILHLLVIVSFLSLAATGMTLKFPDVAFFGWLSDALGGPSVTGVIHRIGAIVTSIYFGAHLFMIARLFSSGKITIKGLFTEDYSMVPNLRDLREFGANLKWFVGLGPRPTFGRWTYWEKFDYFAVFWGVFIIGSTGLILWFPVTATFILPGWAINIATIIHSDEALLASAFIFTIHFFNTHFRPGVFPMDPVIFTGRIPIEHFKEERKREYDQMVEAGELEQYIVGPPPKWLVVSSWIFGLTFLATGLTLIGAIIYGMLFVYM